MTAENNTITKTEEMQRVSPQIFQEQLPAKADIKIEFPREIGLEAIDTHIIKHDDDMFWVADLPARELKVDSPVLVSFHTPKAFFIFATKIVWQESDESLGLGPMIVLERPMAWKRIQRRTNFRVDMRVPVMLTMKKEPRENLEAQSVNLSASGMLVATKRALAVGEKLDLDFSIPMDSGKDSTFHLQADVMRQMSVGEGKAAFPFQAGIQFIALTDTDTEKLTQVLWQQLRKKVAR